MSYQILTDSCCDFPPQRYRELGLISLPLSITFRGETYPDRNDDSLRDMYAGLRAGEAASTAAANPQQWEEALEPVLASGEDALILAFSSGLSTTYQSACIAADEMKERFPERKILVVDSLCASLGQGMLVDLTVQEKRQGKTLDEAAAFAEKNRLYLCHWFTVGDLSQLRRGGRLSAGKAIVGNLLNIKPVLHVDNEGHLVPMASAKGRKKSIEALVSHMEESAVAPEQQRVYISHGDCLADAELLAQMVRDRLHVSSVTIGDVGPVVGAHSGAGTLALFFVGTHR